MKSYSIKTEPYGEISVATYRALGAPGIRVWARWTIRVNYCAKYVARSFDSLEKLRRYVSKLRKQKFKRLG